VWGWGLAQKIASNYVSGFIILLDRSMSIGDMISVDKFNGKVTQINTRYTVLQGLDGANLSSRTKCWSPRRYRISH
jgi:small-conductance mechanosensitive channel